MNMTVKIMRKFVSNNIPIHTDFYFCTLGNKFKF